MCANFLPETFLIVRRIQRDTIINVHRYSCKCQNLMKLEFSRQVFEEYVIRFHETWSSAGRVVPCGRTDRMKLIVDFRNHAGSA